MRGLCIHQMKKKKKNAGKYAYMWHCLCASGGCGEYANKRTRESKELYTISRTRQKASKNGKRSELFFCRHVRHAFFMRPTRKHTYIFIYSIIFFFSQSSIQIFTVSLADECECTRIAASNNCQKRIIILCMHIAYTYIPSIFGFHNCKFKCQLKQLCDSHLYIYQFLRYSYIHVWRWTIAQLHNIPKTNIYTYEYSIQYCFDIFSIEQTNHKFINIASWLFMYISSSVESTIFFCIFFFLFIKASHFSWISAVIREHRLHIYGLGLSNAG